METNKRQNEEQQAAKLSGEELEQAVGGVGTPRTPAEKFGIISVPDKQEPSPSAETHFI